MKVLATYTQMLKVERKLVKCHDTSDLVKTIEKMKKVGFEHKNHFEKENERYEIFEKTTEVSANKK